MSENQQPSYASDKDKRIAQLEAERETLLKSMGVWDLMKQKDDELASLKSSLAEKEAQIVDTQAKSDHWHGEQIKLQLENGVMRLALEKIVSLEPDELPLPSDFDEQIKNCSECQGWAKHHPIQNGICDTHRKPLWEREKHDERERSAIGYRPLGIAKQALLSSSTKSSLMEKVKALVKVAESIMALECSDVDKELGSALTEVKKEIM